MLLETSMCKYLLHASLALLPLTIPCQTHFFLPLLLTITTSPPPPKWIKDSFQVSAGSDPQKMHRKAFRAATVRLRESNWVWEAEEFTGRIQRGQSWRERQGEERRGERQTRQRTERQTEKGEERDGEERETRQGERRGGKRDGD